MNDKHPAAQSVWGGEERCLADRATQVPIVQSVVFGYPDMNK